MQSLRRSGLIAAILGVLVSCGGRASPAIEPSRPGGVGSADELGPGPPIVLVDAGTAPRRPLRLRFHAGTTEFLALDQSLRMVLVTNDANHGRDENRVAPPPMQLTMRLGVPKVLPDGQAVFDAVIERTRLSDHVPLENPQGRRQMEATLAELVGLRIQGRLSTLGVPSELKLFVPPGTSAEMRQQLDQLRDSLDKLYIRLPEQPVGVGATWIVPMRASIGGITADVRYRYTLTRLDATSASFSVAIAFAAAPQSIRIDDTTTTFESFAGSGKGFLSMQWDHLAPNSAVTSLIDGSFTVASSDGSELHSTLHLDIGMTARPSEHTED